MLKLFSSLALMAVCGFACAQAASTDGEMWNEIDVSAPLSGRATLTVPLVLRASFQLPNPQLAGLGPIVDVAVQKHLTLTAGYLFVVLPNSGRGYDVDVPLVAVTFREEIGHLRLQDRNRVEGLFGIPKSPIRYRNKLVVDLPSFSEEWLPFVSDEVFYDCSQSLWSQNRFQAGLGRQINEQVRLDMFYLERDAHKSLPSATHAVGISLELRLTAKTRRKGVSHEEN
jgi:Protein of unknown function (DUF2490)